MSINESNPLWPKHGPLLFVTLASLAIGLYARFKGLGTWPLGVDEYYISRSIDNVLRTGLPQFSCGGFYTRGLLYQYIVGGLRLTGLQPEFAGRLVSVLSSLAVLPAAYLLAKRLQGRTVGLLVLTVLSLSVWEIEMARFARMYAPFQAVFAWYLLYFVRFTVDGQRSALIGMVALSIVGVLTWEGGALMGLANLLPPFINHDNGRLRRSGWFYLVGMSALFAALYFAAALDLRGLAGHPGNISAEPVQEAGHPVGRYAPWLMPGVYGMWSAFALLSVALSLAAAPWIWKLRDRWLASSALAAVLVMALVHQFMAAAAILVLTLLLHLLHWRELFNRKAQWFWAALAASAVFWVCFGLFADALYPNTTDSGRFVFLAQEFVGFPDIVNVIVTPWGKAIPVLSVALFVAMAALAVQSVFRIRSGATVLGTMLVLVLTMVVAIGASAPPRVETRYAFFLYPIFITLAIIAVAMVCEKFTRNKEAAMWATISLSLLAFVLTEDFQPRHIFSIDSRESNFRIGLSVDRAAHYYPRSDFRGLAQWLEDEVQEDDLVISGLSTLSQYYHNVDYFFLDAQDPLFRQYACKGGGTQRWTGLPLLYNYDALESKLSTGRQIIILLYPDRARRFAQEAAARDWPIESYSPSIPGIGDVLMLNPT